MSPWELFTPQTVFMVATKQEDGWRCKPFSWLVPLNKGPLFGIMVKRESQTLKNLLAYDRFSIATVPAASMQAHDVLMTTAPEPETQFWPMEVQKGMAFLAAVGAISIAECTFLGYSDLLIAAEHDSKKRTHLMVMGRIDNIVEVADGAPLLHQAKRTFAEPVFFEVPGY